MFILWRTTPTLLILFLVVGTPPGGDETRLTGSEGLQRLDDLLGSKVDVVLNSGAVLENAEILRFTKSGEGAITAIKVKYLRSYGQRYVKEKETTVGLAGIREIKANGLVLGFSGRPNASPTKPSSSPKAKDTGGDAKNRNNHAAGAREGSRPVRADSKKTGGGGFVMSRPQSAAKSSSKATTTTHGTTSPFAQNALVDRLYLLTKDGPPRQYRGTVVKVSDTEVTFHVCGEITLGLDGKEIRRRVIPEDERQVPFKEIALLQEPVAPNNPYGLLSADFPKAWKQSPEKAWEEHVRPHKKAGKGGEFAPHVQAPCFVAGNSIVQILHYLFDEDTGEFLILEHPSQLTEDALPYVIRRPVGKESEGSRILRGLAISGAGLASGVGANNALRLSAWSGYLYTSHFCTKHLDDLEVEWNRGEIAFGRGQGTVTGRVRSTRWHPATVMVRAGYFKNGAVLPSDRRGYSPTGHHVDQAVSIPPKGVAPFTIRFQVADPSIASSDDIEVKLMTYAHWVEDEHGLKNITQDIAKGAAAKAALKEAWEEVKKGFQSP